MAYNKTNWQDQEVERPHTYEVNQNEDGSYTLVNAFGNVTQMGTPVNALNMNKLEAGVAGTAIRLFNLDETFTLDEWAKYGDKLYKSLQNGNKGHAVTEADWWTEVSLGGSGLEICDIGMALYVDESKGLRRYLNGQLVAINSNTQGFLKKLKSIQALHPSAFTSEENWQAESLLNVNGTCYKFVINELAGTIRIPKYPDFVEILPDKLSVVGNGMTLGLTNGTDNAGFIDSGQFSMVGVRTGAYNVPVGTQKTDTYPAGELAWGITTDPTKSGIETTVNSTKLKLRYFIQIATGSEDKVDIVNEIELNNPYSLFDCKYSEIKLNNLSWLWSNRQWNSKAVYTKAYDELLKQYNAPTIEGLSVKKSDENYTDYDFVINTANETFRLPIKSKKAGGRGVVGNGMTLGLTDGASNAGLYRASGSGLLEGTGLYGLNIGTPIQRGDTLINNVCLGITTDPTKSGIETTDTDLYLYYYVGETVQNANLIEAGRIQEQLNNKADIVQVPHLAMPSDRYVDLSGPVNGGQYIAPADGVVCLWKITTGRQYCELFTLKDDNSTTADTNKKLVASAGCESGLSPSLLLPVKKGQKFYTNFNFGGGTRMFRFFYAEGVK